jgi:hypothetical protein
MRKILLVLVLLLPLCLRAQTNSPVAAAGPAVETLVCLRHGEKPPGGLGQLNCRGLNRALALPDVLLKKYGQPQFIFAPSPNEKIDGDPGYYYVRPLMTIEPTAVRCGLPVNTGFGYLQIKGLENELGKPPYQNATVFISWEHVLLHDFVKNIMKDNGGNPSQVPNWSGKDYDSIYLVKITRSGGHTSVSFTLDHEGLNNLGDDCR